MQSAPWLTVSLNILSVAAVWSIAVVYLLSDSAPVASRVAVLLIALAYSGWFYYVLYEAIAGNGAGAFDPVLARDLGELAAVLAPFALFVAIALPDGQTRNARHWVAPCLLGLAFAAGNVADMIANQ